MVLIYLIKILSYLCLNINAIQLNQECVVQLFVIEGVGYYLNLLPFIDFTSSGDALVDDFYIHFSDVQKLRLKELCS